MEVDVEEGSSISDNCIVKSQGKWIYVLEDYRNPSDGHQIPITIINSETLEVTQRIPFRDPVKEINNMLVGDQISVKSVLSLWKYYEEDMHNKSIVFDDRKNNFIFPDLEGNLNVINQFTGKIANYIKLSEYAESKM